MSETTQTIAAVATPPGEGGIGILRISGADALEAAAPVCGLDPHELEPRRATICEFHRRSDSSALDRGLITYFPAPRSYTGEHVLECSTHGSPLLLQKLLEDVVQHDRTRPAEPGEFTRRAYENNKLDLAQADAVASLISARSEAALKSSARQLEGELSERVDELREGLIYCRSRIEAGLDFSDQDSVGTIPFDEIDERLAGLSGNLEELVEQGQQGVLLEQGCFTAIIGRPNVGKSSLMNRLVRSDRVIVTHQPGTTRDVIRDQVVIDGIPFHLHDTAGIRPDPDQIEAEGIRRSKDVLEKADLVLFMVDESESLTEADRRIRDMLNGHSHLLVANKIDREPALDDDRYRRELGKPPDCRISARTGEGIDRLRRMMVDQLHDGTVTVDNPLVTRTRHLEALRESLRQVDRARRGISEDRDPTLVAEDLREAAEAAGRITGEITTDDLLDQIFSRFCIGK